MISEKPSAEDGGREAAGEEAPYSTFSLWQKRWTIFLAALTGMFSPMSSFIFYPAIHSIAESLRVTVVLINLAITTYMVVSGVVPALLGNAADKFGRRPVYLFALSIYSAANIGLGLQNTYAGLLVLRGIQSAGSSGTISLGYGVLSDITTRAERGSYVGVLLLGPNVAPPVGPILGGVLAAKLGWKWIFWMLCILGGACLLLVLVALPETSRVIVGNGSKPARGIYETLISALKKRLKGHDKTETDVVFDHKSRAKFTLPNPLACLRLLLLWDVAVVLLCNGIYYTIACTIQASLSTLFIEVYNYQSLEAGLIYIPFGVASLAGAFSWGKVLDYDFARLARQAGLSTDEVRQQGNTIDFPIENARLRSALILVVLNTIGTVGYGWFIHFRVHVSVPVILQTVVGFATSAMFVALGTLLTDLNPNRASTASASANIVRCALAATALAVLQPIIDRVGVGWCFTIFGLLGALCGPFMVWGIQRGAGLRRKRQAAEESG